jgi:cytochrome c-type biogenesis protein CcmE
MVKMILDAVKILFVFFVGATLLLYLFQGRMIFFPQPTAPQNQSRYAGNEIRLHHGGVTLTGWFFKNEIGPGTRWSSITGEMPRMSVSILRISGASTPDRFFS